MCGNLLRPVTLEFLCIVVVKLRVSSGECRGVPYEAKEECSRVPFVVSAVVPDGNGVVEELDRGSATGIHKGLVVVLMYPFPCSGGLAMVRKGKTKRGCRKPIEKRVSGVHCMNGVTELRRVLAWYFGWGLWGLGRWTMGHG